MVWETVAAPVGVGVARMLAVLVLKACAYAVHD